jgi:kinesin family protein 1
MNDEVKGHLSRSADSDMQTGSGKSHTMLGYAGDPGLIPRVSAELFRRIADDARPDLSLRVSVSLMEIYNERVRDLLNINSEASLRVRNNPKSGPYVGEAKPLFRKVTLSTAPQRG